MRPESVEVFFRDEERASGVMLVNGANRIPWTAIKGPGIAWYIVLHGEIDTGDAALYRLFMSAIQNRLELKKAA
jgi:hypothetical protein